MISRILLSILLVAIAAPMRTETSERAGNKQQPLREWKFQLFQWETKDLKEARAFWDDEDDKVPARARVVSFSVFRHDGEKVFSMVTVGNTNAYVELLPDEDRKDGPQTNIEFGCRSGNSREADFWATIKKTFIPTKKFDGKQSYSMDIGSSKTVHGELQPGKFETAAFRVMKVTVKLCDDQAITMIKGSYARPKPPRRKK